KQNPRNLRGRVVDAEEPHRAGDQRDDQKNDRPSQHGTSSSPGGLFTPPTNGCFVANAMPTVPSAAARAGVVSPGCFVRMRTPAPARVAYSSRASPAERTVMLPLTIVDPLASSPARRLPSWLKRDLPRGNGNFFTHDLLRELRLETV